MKQTTSYAAFVGLDWADRSHQICLRAAGSERDEQSVINQEPAALHEWARRLRARFPQGKIAVALEQSKGPIIYALTEHAHLELYPINPAILAKYRSAAKCSGTKNDPLDAALICELLRLHADWLRPLPQVPAQVRELQMLLENRRGLVDARSALSNQLTATLKGYFPQALMLIGDGVASTMACEFLKRWPTLQAVKQARPTTLERFYHEHGSRCAELIQERVTLLKTAVALTNDAAVLAVYPMLTAALVAQLEVLDKVIADFDQRISAKFAEQADHSIFDSLPGAGAQLAPRLLVAFGPNRDRYKNAQEIQQYSGIAPVQEQSGNTCSTRWRWHCPKFLRQSFHEFAGCSVPQSAWAKAYYEIQIARGKSRQKVLRALAYKWQRVLFRCWQNHEPYDETRYLAALRRRGSPLIAYLDHQGFKAA
jgi:transposase